MIYIAAPYSDPMDDIQHKRFLAARDYAYLLMQNNEICFSPVVYGRQFEKVFKMGGQAGAWAAFNHHMMTTATKLHILRLPGWDKSAGVAMEMKWANELSIDSSYIELVS